MRQSDLEELGTNLQERKDALYQSGVDRGVLIGLSHVRNYVDNQREPLLRKILSGETINQEEDTRLTVYSELVTELERLKEL